MTDKKSSTTTEGTNKSVEKYLKEVDDEEDSGRSNEVFFFFFDQRNEDKTSPLIANLILWLSKRETKITFNYVIDIILTSIEENFFFLPSLDKFFE